VAFPGVLAAVALGAGIAVQPLAHRLQNASINRGTADAAATALVTAGCLAAAAAHPGVAAATGAALLLGAGYGMSIICGLREVEHLAPAHELGSLVAVFYSLAYSGLAIPYLLALAGPHLGYPTALLLLALTAALTTLLLTVQGRRHPPRHDTTRRHSTRQHRASSGRSTGRAARRTPRRRRPPVMPRPRGRKGGPKFRWRGPPEKHSSPDADPAVGASS